MAQDEFDRLFTYMNKEFSVINKKLDTKADKGQIDSLINSVDGIIKRLDDDQANNAARDIILNRHDRWIHEIAYKDGIKLSRP